MLLIVSLASPEGLPICPLHRNTSLIVRRSLGNWCGTCC
jgi:hypothetical protein